MKRDDDQYPIISLVYRTLLGREPDTNGIRDYSSALNEGLSPLDMVLDILTSAEFKGRNFSIQEQIAHLISIFGVQQLLMPTIRPVLIELLHSGAIKKRRSEYVAEKNDLKNLIILGDAILIADSYDTQNIYLSSYNIQSKAEQDDALAGLSFNVGKKELEFELHGTTVVIRGSKSNAKFSAKTVVTAKVNNAEVRESFVIDCASLRETMLKIDVKPTVSVVGRFSNSTGISMQSHAFISTLDAHSELFLVDTRPAESDWSTMSPSMRARRVESEKRVQTDIAIYTDVINNGDFDKNWLKASSADIRWACAVFDSDRMPAAWVRILNTFDGILVADDFVKEAAISSGVTRPVFVLPLALDIATLQQEAHAVGEVENEKFRFGCFAGYGRRKNLQQLIRVFSATFKDRSDVELFIHSPLDFSGYYENLKNWLKEEKIENVIISKGRLSFKNYVRLFKTIDVYALISKGEGYSITPRQAMALGIPTIISGGSAHQSMADSGNFIVVEPNGKEVAHYEAINGEDYGLQFTYADADVRKALLDAFQNFSKHKAGSNEFMEYAQQFSVSRLGEQYSSLVCAKNVFMEDRNELHKDRIITNDFLLYQKLEKFLQMRQKNSATVGRLQRIVIPGHDGGFYSVMNTFVSHFVWNFGRPEVAYIVPDWRVDHIKKYRKIDKFMSFCYGRSEDGNIFTKLFEPIPGMYLNNEDYDDPSCLEDDVIYYDDFNEKNEPNLTYIHAYKLYKDKDFQTWREWYHSFFAKHFHLRGHIQAAIDLFVYENFNGHHVIGAHVRHPSHGIEQPGRSVPTVDLYISHIIKEIQENQGKSIRIFLATDQETIVDRFRELFGDMLVVRNDARRTTKVQDSAFSNLSTNEKMREGHQIQHLMSADEEKWSVENAKDVIIDTHLLASCNTFFHITSNIATAVAYINPKVKMIYAE